MKKHLTEEQKAALDAKRKRIKELIRQIADMPEDQRIELAKRIPVANVDGHVLSLNNQCLLALQNPNVTIVGGFKQWLGKGRVVNKGEHGMAIWFPSKPSKEENESEGSEKEIRFLLATVFDVSQTSALQ